MPKIGAFFFYYWVKLYQDKPRSTSELTSRSRRRDLWRSSFLLSYLHSTETSKVQNLFSLVLEADTELGGLFSDSHCSRQRRMDLPETLEAEKIDVVRNDFPSGCTKEEAASSSEWKAHTFILDAKLRWTYQSCASCFRPQRLLTFDHFLFLGGWVGVPITQRQLYGLAQKGGR